MKLMKPLIISYYFPPIERVAGRRWGKFYKYLRKEGVEAFVIAGDYSADREALWKDDVEPYEDHITRFKPKGQKEFFRRVKSPTNIIDKIRWHISFLTFKIFGHKTQAPSTDASIRDVDSILLLASQLIEAENITHVVLTVGPFGYAGVLTKLKDKYPHLKFLLDYRDLPNEVVANWEANETTSESVVLKACDAITLVDQSLHDKLLDRYPTGLPSLFVLPHGVDQNEQKQGRETVADIIYGGATYPSDTRYFGAFSTWMATQSSLTAKLFFTELSEEVRACLQATQNVEVSGVIPNAQLHRYQEGSSYNLLVYPDFRSNAFSSKFFELVAYRKPILYFGPRGATRDFIEKNNLGVCCSSIEEVSDYNENLQKLDFNESFDLKPHSFDYLTKQLIAILDSVN